MADFLIGDLRPDVFDLFPEEAARLFPQVLTDPDYRYKTGRYYTFFKIPTPVAFLKCAEGPLRKDFETRTGIKVKKGITVNCPMDFTGLGLEKGPVSYMNQGLIVGDGKYKPVKIAWKSKSGRIYDITDTDIDCDDLECWFEELDVNFVYQALYPGAQLPFKLKDPGYALVVRRLGIDIEISLFLKPECAAETSGLIEKIIDHIGAFNAASEKKGRKDGVVHHWNVELAEPLLIQCRIDMGSAGFKFFRKLLEYFSQLGCFTKVQVE